MIQHLHDYIPVNSIKELSVYQKILDNTAILVLADEDRQIIYVNQKFCEKSGLKRDDVLGKPMDILRASDFSKDELENMWLTLEQGNVWKGELLNVQADNQTYWEEAVIYPFRSNGDKPYQYLSIGSDITPFKNAMQIKDQFLANMSHELRTPLHSIYSLTNLLEETTLSDEQSSYVENILNATGILMRMVEDMLDLNKIENGQIRFQSKIFNPQIIVNSLAKMFREKAREKKLNFHLEYDPSVPEFVLGDPFRLKQILVHLLENAVKYTQRGDIFLKCRLAGNNPESFVFEFIVTDTGIGIAKENLAMIQEKFQQEQMDDKRIYKGQGLGLSIVKQLIELQRGEFTISSGETEGTQVQFLIPYQFPLSEKADDPLMTNGSEPEKTHTMRVLIAEDVDINQLVIKKHMQKFGFNAEFAENGKMAIEKLRTGHYDIVLMDMQMPVMDGYEAIRIIRNDFPEPVKSIPIISITASVMGEAPRKCLEAGANDYVPKPYDIKDLRMKMEKWVNPTVNNQITQGMNMKQEEKKYESLIDLDYLEQLSEGDDDFTISMLSYFLENTPGVINELKQFHKDKDWKSLRNVAHKFKPQLTFMGIKSVFNEVETIEQNAANEVKTDDIPALIKTVEEICSKAMEEIRSELEKILDKNQD
ncbi:MAG: response regulator [Bacteroidetes bacterium]|nr:MAG: response regulator [Bacteroidota bacterium]